MNNRTLTIYSLLVLFLVTLNISAQDTKVDSTAQAPAAAHSDLAAASANPIASMISLPFQNNFSFGTGDYDRMGYTTNLQPVIPFKLNKKLSYINRVIIPIGHKPSNAESGGKWGMGNMNWTMYVVPQVVKIKEGLGFTYGVGPVLSIPTATSSEWGGDSFGVGATAVGLFLSKHLVGGIMVGFADSYKTDNLRTFFAQYFITYNIKKGWFINSTPTFGADFNAPEGQKWSVPLGGGGGKLVKFGGQPIKLMLQAFTNVVSPDAGADWSLQFTAILLFPTKS